MIREVRVVNHLSDEISIKLTESEPTHGLIIKDITGLGPSKAVLGTSDYASIDGVSVSNIRMDKRTIVMTLLFAFCPDIEQARRNTYRYFPIKKTITLYFYTDYGCRYISGIVESNEPNIFSQESSCVITITCPDPYFSADDGNTRNMDLEDLCLNVRGFEFPYENNSLDEDLTEFGNTDWISRYKYAFNPNVTSVPNQYWREIPNFTIYNPGIATDGIEFEICLKDYLSSINYLMMNYLINSVWFDDIIFMIKNNTTKESMYLSFRKIVKALYWPEDSTGKFIEPSDNDKIEYRITVSTKQQKKSITLQYMKYSENANGQYTYKINNTYDVMNSLIPRVGFGYTNNLTYDYSKFIHLEQGNNIFTVALYWYEYGATAGLWHVADYVMNILVSTFGIYYTKFFSKPNRITISFDPRFEGV